MNSTRAVAVISEAAVETGQINATVVRAVEIATYHASLKRSTKKRSRIKYVKHRPNFLVVKVIRALKKPAGTKNARIWLNGKVRKEKITSCRLLNLSA